MQRLSILELAVALWPTETEILIGKIAVLRIANKNLRIENAELRSRLGSDSSSSHKPPSSN